MATEFEVMARILGDSKSAQDAFNSASKSAQHFQGAVGKTNGALVALGVGFAAVGFAAIKFGKSAFMEAARVAELDVAIDAVGKSTGVGAIAMDRAAKAVKSMGIETAAAQQMVIEFAQGQIDIAQAAKVARVAQDLAVISQKNSTQVATLLSRAIMTGNSMLLKSAGVSRQASEGYTKYAKALGKTTTQLTAAERQQAIVNLIMDEGKKVAGVYEAAMLQAGKVLRSFARLFNDIKVSIGGALLAGFGPAIKATYDMVNAFDKAISEGGKFYPIVEALTITMKNMIAPFTEIIKKTTDFVKNFKTGEINVSALADKMQAILPVVSALATGLSALASKSLLANVPILGNLTKGLNPVMIAITTLIMMTPQLRDKVFELGAELKKLLPPLLAIAGAVVTAGTEFMNEFIVPIVGAMINMLKPAIAGVTNVLGMFTGATKSAQGAIEVLKTALVIITGVFVGLKVVQLANLAVTKAQAIWDGVLTVATFVLIAATDGLSAAFVALGFASGGTIQVLGAIATVIAVVVTALVVWYQKSVWFRNMVRQVTEGIANAFIVMANIVIKALQLPLATFIVFVDGAIWLYNQLAKITRLPKIDPIDPFLIPEIQLVNIGLETMTAKLDVAAAKTRALRAEMRRWAALAEYWVAKADEDNETYGGGVDKVKEKIEELKAKTIDYVKNALEKARTELGRQKDAMESYAQSISGAITGALSFGDAFAEVTDYVKRNADAIKQQQDALDSYSKSVAQAITGQLSLSKAYEDNQAGLAAIAKAKQDMVTAEEAFNTAISTGDMSGAIRAQEDYFTAVDAANQAQKVQLTFMQQLRKQANEAIGFAASLRKLADSGLSQDALGQIVSAGAVTGSAMATELLAGGSEAINYTNYLFQQIAQAADATGAVAASKFYTVGETMGLDFMAALNSQAEKATIFAQRVQQLVEAGMSKEAIAQVLAAGATAGTEIADYLLVAGSNRILGEGGVNDIVASLQIVGDTLGKSLAPTFYQAGVTLAEQIVAGLKSQLGQVQALLKKIQTVEGVKKALETAKTTADTTTAPLMGLTPQLTNIPSGFLRAEGGVATHPIAGIFGEKGPEALVPLEKYGGLGGGDTYYITVQATVADEKLPAIIVDALRRFNRTVGPIKVKTI